jgi:hypothetical protein
MPAPSTDLELRISTEDAGNATRLRYVLHSPSGRAGYTYYEIEGKTEIRGRPEEYQTRLFATLEELHQGRGSDGSILLADEVEKELEGIGRELYEELFPKSLKVEYRELRDKVTTLLIVSDEPWIPWELVKPPDDDYLCCRFELTRWLAGETVPSKDFGAVELGAARVACIEAGTVPGVAPLPRAADESRLLADLAGRHSGVEVLIAADATYSETERVLRVGGSGILHFVGHGEFDADEPNVSRFLLTDGRAFRPRDLLHSGIETRIRQDRPLVFFNSCQVARQGHTLTRLGGWASRWVLDCGCGAFIGPQWSVRDASSLAFAGAFYGALERGETVARAALEARRRAREESGTGWLAYTVYARPGARLRLGLGPTPLRVPESRWRPEISPPGALLRAEYGVVPFHGRVDELDNLLGWSHAEAAVQVRLYTGAGGMGKTRLALELCRKLRDEGWQTGFLAPDPARTPAEVWQDLRAREKPSLIVVDYAETRRELLVPLLRELYQDQKGTIRMLLLARAALDWWEQLKREGDGVGDLISGPATRWFTLMPLARTSEGREESYRKAAQAFSDRLGKPQPAAVPELDAEYYERVLLLHMKALADIEGVPVKDEDGILDYVLHRERRFWGRLAKERKLPEDLTEGIGRAMALLTLGGGVESEEKAVAALRALRILADRDYGILVQVARLLHESYPGQRWIEPILPDLLGEHLIQREMEKGADELLDIVLGPRSGGEKLVDAAG